MDILTSKNQIFYSIKLFPIITFCFSIHREYPSTSNKGIMTLHFYCSQSQIFSRKSRKIFETEKQRDGESIARFDCGGTLKIKINTVLRKVSLELTHKILHARPEKVTVTDEIKATIKQQLHLAPKEIFSSLEADNLKLTQKQVHYWWTRQIQELYKRDDNQLVSTKMLLEDAQYEILLHNCEAGTKYIGFVTSFLTK